MKKLLVTGFDPFGGEAVNPSWEAVQRLPERVGDYEIRTLQLPTVFGLAAQKVLELAEQFQPDAILCVGQAGGRNGISVELLGINLREARIPDNEGNQPQNVPVVENGPAAYFSTLPVRSMVSAVNKAGIPAVLSYSAGAFVCNDLLYTLLHRYAGTQTLVGFIHVPFLPEQAKDSAPSLPLDTIVQALVLAAEQLA